MDFSQQGYDIRFEWGLAGVKALAPLSDVVIIVDVLSFSTCVDVVVNRGWGGRNHPLPEWEAIARSRAGGGGIPPC